jgi:predicted restriction endonuclease
VAAEPAISYLYNGYRGFTQIKNRLGRINDDFGDLNSFITAAFGVDMPKPVIPVELLAAEQEAESTGSFDPDSVLDERKKVFAAIVRRRGQPKFRKELLEAYEGKCAVTGCSVEAVLEAAHIKSYAGDKTNHVTNGILLRADIHTLYDLGKLKIDEKGVVHLGIDLEGSIYGVHSGQKISLPKGVKKSPNTKALKNKFIGGIEPVLALL